MALCENSYHRLIQHVESGRAAFEAGRYLQAVLHWEQAWREESGPARPLLQGLMQAAGAYRKQEMAEPLGMFKLLLLAIEKVGPVPDGFLGLDLDGFRAGLERSRKEAITWVAGGPRPGPAGTLARPART
jgi:predicted metal-dependent hydrolase